MHILNNYPNSVYSQQIENFEKVEGFSSFGVIRSQQLTLLQYSAKERGFVPQFPQMLWGQFWGQLKEYIYVTY